MYEKINPLLSRIVHGKTFVDIGPCFGTIFEKLSVAHSYGAKSVTAIDQWGVGDGVWEALFDRLEKMGLTKEDYEWKSTEVCNYEGTFDVVYCSGVIYHQPDPFSFMNKLYQMTNEHLVLKSTISHLVPEGGCLFLPAVSNEDRKRHAEDWRSFLGGRPAAGLTPPVIDWRPNSWDWWWLFSEEFLVALCQLAGFKVLSYEKIGLQYDGALRETLIHATKAILI